MSDGKDYSELVERLRERANQSYCQKAADAIAALQRRAEAAEAVVGALAPCLDREQGMPHEREITARVPARLWNKVRDAYEALDSLDKDSGHAT